MTHKKSVKIAPAKGRPMLTWAGKRPLAHVTAFPAQHVETFAPQGPSADLGASAWAQWPAAYPHGGLLFHGDLLATGFRDKVKPIRRTSGAAQRDLADIVGAGIERCVDIEHRPARLRAEVTRKKGRLHVEIKDFISPTIIERLEQQAGIVKPRINNWRAMVDCVMIDTAYNGTVFNAALSDIPERKTDLVDGHYDFSAPAGKTVVAIKVIDMLGGEVLVAMEA